MQRKEFEIKRTRWVVVGKKKFYAGDDGEPIILPPLPDVRYIKNTNGKSSGKKTPEWLAYCTARDIAKDIIYM